MLLILLWVPWVALGLYLALRLRLPRTLPGGVVSSSRPRVSIVVPARNEERNIESCVRSLAASDYSDFEIIVVDDRSEDRTAAVAASVDPGNAERVVVVEGRELPDGWLGKPWACEQGAEVATGELLLFTDADTTHSPELLGRVVSALFQRESDALTLLGRQETDSFWERLVQPHVFAGLLLRYPDFRDPLPPDRWRDAISNGQFTLFRREVYEAVGGHEAVKGDVVEDLRMGQLLVKGGHRLQAWLAEDAFSTRMYQSLSEIVEGWSKNVAMASRMSVPPLVAAFALPVTVVAALYYWVAPPVLVALRLWVTLPPAIQSWAVGSVVIGILAWTAIYVRFGVPFRYALIYPLGSLVTVGIFLRSHFRGQRVEWKGREYVVAAPE